ncbi:class I SAM-dependent methyltransferase [Alsobacter sp. KACC 23698]|uniref:Class I SAM-dependent methyltransferase n=1 Tax=Alsobacter sp. KACC 23698 TaxID=3149229 RepID=A0AAU7JJQ8_9HYPH
MSEPNLATFRNRTVVAAYQAECALQPAEATILDSIRDRIRGEPILDLGVGVGRTTPALTALTDVYVGMDYSPEMVAACRVRFPDERFEVGDARDLSRFATGSFGLVLFSFNGLDYVDHADRLKVLGECRRVLKPGSPFVFSTHNRNASLQSPWALRRLRGDPLRDPMGCVKKLLTYPGGIVLHAARRRREVQGADYAILNDQAHMYSLLTYYITPQAQVLQLEAAGFRAAKVVGRDGGWRSPDEFAGMTDSWIYYMAHA